MADRITIEFEKLSVTAELLDTPTADAFKASLPIASEVNRWGEEIYFSTPVKAKLEPDAREVVERGEIGYWPPGKAMAIFFGPTPASRGDECRAASAVNVFARITGDLKRLSSVPDGSKVTVRATEGAAKT
jgi:hypothetical protein